MSLWALPAPSGAAEAAGRDAPLPVTGSGATPDDGQDDLAAFRAAFSRAARSGSTEVSVPAGLFELSDTLEVPAAVRRLTLAPGAVLRGTGSAQVLVRRGRGAGAGLTLSAPAPAGAKAVQLASATGVKVGSWLFLGSDDAYQGDKQMLPGMLREVRAVSGGTVTLDLPLHRALTTRPTAWPYRLAPALTVSGGAVEQAEPTRVQEPAVEMIGVDHPVLDGVEVRRCGGAGVRVAESVAPRLDVDVHDCLDDESGSRLGTGPHLGYGVELMGATRDAVVRGRAARVRHAFTTDPAFRTLVQQGARRGEPERVTVTMDVTDTTSTGLDTHESGYDITFQDCVVTRPGRYLADGTDNLKEGGGGVFVRARATTLTGVRVVGAPDPAVQVARPSAPEQAWSGSDATVLSGVWATAGSGSTAVLLRQPSVLDGVEVDGYQQVGIQAVATADGSALRSAHVDLHGFPGSTGLLGAGYVQVLDLTVSGATRRTG